MKFLDPRSRQEHILTKQGSVLPYDKLEHLILAAVLTLLFYFTIPGLIGNIVLSQMAARLLGIAWEVKDGLKPYNRFGDIQGFSFLDLIANEIGLRLAGDIILIFF